MPITFKKGDILKDDSVAVVNTVNCVCTMGKGLALRFKNTYPEMYKLYLKSCKAGEIKIGEMHMVLVTNTRGKRMVIINFPTKNHWGNDSKIQYIRLGLKDLVKKLNHYKIPSVAIPPLGCGNGNLNWNEVKPLIIKAFKDSKIEVTVYEP